MADPTLHGNHDKCPACELRRNLVDTAQLDRPEVPCNVCDGLGFLPLLKAEIVRRTVQEALRWYWREMA